MSEPKEPNERLSRRRFMEASITATAVGASAVLAGCSKPAAPAPHAQTPQAAAKPDSHAPAPAPSERARAPVAAGAYNILLVLVDQERFFQRWPFPVPGRERLRALGVSFENHQINSNVCSPSRSVLYTGQHIQHTGVFDNVNAPWQPSMSSDIPTLGTMLRELGYYTAYKGKFHLAVELEEENDPESPQHLLTEVLERYGFADYFGVGDIIGNARGGYLNDETIASTAVRWLRAKGRPMADAGRPWFLAVNFVNPHDVMYVDTDRPHELVQKASDPVMTVLPPPDTPHYRASWDVPLPISRHQAFDAPGRPNAHREFQTSRSVLLGNWPDEERRWRLLQDYYFNCIRDSDRHLVRVLDELEAQSLMDKTIILFTSDHGELGGAHQMHGKGACAYREQNHVPLIVAHPAGPRGQRCNALTSHLDLAPTLLAFAREHNTRTDLPEPGAQLKGKSLTDLLRDPERAGVQAVRDGTLFCFNMFAYLDGRFLASLKEIRDERRLQKLVKAASALRRRVPGLHKRGAIRSYFDGRYRLTRYYSPKEHHDPQTLDMLLARNDLELFDLEQEPHELENLASKPDDHRGLLEHLNTQMRRLLADEVGKDDGAMLPLSRLVDWDLSHVDV